MFILNFQFCRNLQLHRIHVQNPDGSHSHKAADNPDQLEAVWSRQYSNTHENFQHVEAGLKGPHIPAYLRTLLVSPDLPHDITRPFTMTDRLHLHYFSRLTLQPRHDERGVWLLRRVGQVVQAGDEQIAGHFDFCTFFYLTDAEEVVDADG